MKIFSKQIYVLLVLYLFGVSPILRLSAQTVIGVAAPDPSAMLDVQSTNKGFLPPRMTSSERTAISSPATGLLIFNTTLQCVEMNIGTPAQPAWVCLSVLNTVSAASAAPTLCVNTALTAITHTTTGATGIGAPTGLPDGVTASWAANVLTISGTPTATGTFNYSIPLTGGLGSVSATGTITVSVANTVGTASSTPTLNVNTALTPITHATTGATGIGTPTGLPAGVSAAWASNTLTISGTPTAAGTFNYNIPLTGGCGSVSATGAITVNAAVMGCGAYVAAGVWKAFKCHNLGADESADPFTPSWQLNGHYYQWGRSAVAAAGPTGPGSGEANEGAVAGWNTSSASNGDWADGSKTANDPCPTGFRVPTKAQWDAVINTTLNPTRSFLGTSWAASSTNYANGMRIGSGDSGLFLPAAGYRDISSGTLDNRGSFGNYWSSTEDGSGAWYLDFNNGSAGTYVDGRTYGMSVRCIAE